jgi:hypothetical protein
VRVLRMMGQGSKDEDAERARNGGGDAARPKKNLSHAIAVVTFRQPIAGQADCAQLATANA